MIAFVISVLVWKYLRVWYNIKKQGSNTLNSATLPHYSRVWHKSIKYGNKISHI